jgi:LysM repeat protein
MPAATVGLFVLAAVVIALAFWVQSLVGGDDGKKQVSPVDIQQTQQALRATTPGGQSTVQPPRTVTVGTPGANSTASASTTPGTATSRTPGATTTGTVSTTPGATGKTYKVQPGDTCGKIAGDNNITFEQLRKLNPEINVDCTNLNVDQVIKLQ